MEQTGESTGRGNGKGAQTCGQGGRNRAALSYQQGSAISTAAVRDRAEILSHSITLQDFFAADKLVMENPSFVRGDN